MILKLKDYYERRLITFHPFSGVTDSWKILRNEERDVYIKSINKIKKIIEAKQNNLHGVIAESDAKFVILWENYLPALRILETIFTEPFPTIPAINWFAMLNRAYPQFIADERVNLNHQKFLLELDSKHYGQYFKG
jgi:hypothetical protein